MLAQIAQPIGPDQRRGGGRDEHLSAMTGGGDASSAVDLVAHVALSGQQRRAGVQPDARPGLPVGQASR